jgi:hypothetical protein
MMCIQWGWRAPQTENDGFRLSGYQTKTSASWLTSSTDQRRSWGGKLEIKVTSGDGEQTVTTTDPSFFSSIRMPSNIRSVEIGYYAGIYAHQPFQLRLSIGSPYSWGIDGTRLEVAGNDEVTVNGLFEELSRELESHQAAAFVDHDILWPYLSSLLVCWVVFVVLKWIWRVPRFAPVQILLTQQPLNLHLSIILLIVFMVFVWVSSFLFSHWIFQTCFGPVAFTGDLSDPGTNLRSYLWILGAPLLTIAYDSGKWLLDKWRRAMTTSTE